jgi:hypothetical protein
MSDLRVTNLKGRNAGSAPTLPDGVVITGVATATSFSGNLTGNATTATTATTGLSRYQYLVYNTGVSTLS